ncbi:hypothetical protein EIZ47_01050 [Chryseobacterium lacus]|uniref:Uncharacterized protein n=1 Tax=Chryseobacterium lacus TaxID=2058346 RepID=A0A368N5G4_9FLAO|nr:hypothetical protein [Chryseobacterium lacus]RCU44834.1 hypothetical protein DQ356_01070 [Chryseobacterium lacus]RST32501.1 hypothetical protein EIZ47_01050 [Chryseobacterium lacus]
MKKLFLYSCLVLAAVSCRKEDDEEPYKEPENIETQNAYDDQAIQKYLEGHYLDDRGLIVPFSATDPADDNNTKLSEMNPQKLSSGVVYIVRPNAQPDPGTAIGSTDIIRIMSKTYSHLAVESNGSVSFTSPIAFRSSVDGTGVPEVDPKYYFVSDSEASNAGKTKDYYEIEGFREALQHFRAFNMDDVDNYNMQGIIIVPSRAVFARDSYYPYVNYSMRNRSLVFNFQVYKTTPRP